MHEIIVVPAMQFRLHSATQAKKYQQNTESGSVAPTFSFFVAGRPVILTLSKKNGCTIPWVFYAVGMTPLWGGWWRFFLVRSEAIHNF